MAQYLQLLYNQGVVARSASALLSHLRLEHWNPIRCVMMMSSSVHV